MIHSFGDFSLSWQQRVRATINQMGEASILALYGCFGALVLVATLYFSFIGPQTPGRLERASLALVPQFSFWSWLTSLPLPVPETRQIVAVWLLFFTVAAFAGYGAALYVSTKRGGSRRVLLLVAGMGLLFSFSNVWSLPNLNTDIYNYIVRARVAAVYGENPYVVAADEFPDDPIYPYASHRFTDVGGGKLPVWMTLNIFLAKISGDNPVTNVLTYRLALFLINAASLALVILTVRAVDARRVLTGAILYSWNPIIILFAQSKTDIVMAFFVLLAAWALVARRRWLVAFTFLVMSVLVKLITAPLLVVYVLRSMKLRRWTEVMRGALVAAVLFGLVAVLFYVSAPDGRLFLKYVVAVDETGPSDSNSLGSLVLILFMVLLGVVGVVQDGSNSRLLAGWAVVMLTFSLFLAPFTLSWYLIVTVAVVSILANWHMNLLMWAVSFASFLVNFWDSTFTSEFPSPDIVDVPRSLLYVAVAGVIVAYFGATLILRRIRRNQLA